MKKIKLLSIIFVLFLSVSLILPMEISATDYTKQANIVLTVGSNEKERNFAWYFDDSDPGKVQYVIKKGNTFPSKYSEVKSEVTVSTTENTYIHKATVTGLKADTEYVYRLVNGTKVSEVFSFKTNASDKFNFFFVGDPQVGADDLAKDIEGWSKTLNTALKMFPKTSLMISAGDQVNMASYEHEYTGFLEPSALRSLALAPTVGNHDSWNELFSQHFNLPNTKTSGKNYGVTEAGSDYWYVYNNVLFLHLNSNNTDTSEHKEFMSKAIAANSDVAWKIAVMHHSIYSTAGHATQEDVLKRREELSPVFDELDIDVVLMGHDHVYVRSYIMDITSPKDQFGVQPSVMNPDGILYITAGSASGSKYYDIVGGNQFKYAAVKSQEYAPTFSNVEISDNSFIITTYRVKDKTILDKFEIYKGNNIPSDHTHSLIKVDKIRASCTKEGSIKHWKCSICSASFADKDGNKKLEDTKIDKLEHSFYITVSGRTKRCGKCGYELEIYKVPEESLPSDDNTESSEKPTTSDNSDSSAPSDDKTESSTESTSSENSESSVSSTDKTESSKEPTTSDESESSVQPDDNTDSSEEEDTSDDSDDSVSSDDEEESSEENNSSDESDTSNYSDNDDTDSNESTSNNITKKNNDKEQSSKTNVLPIIIVILVVLVALVVSVLFIIKKKVKNK